jgi:hypothetical protein
LNGVKDAQILINSLEGLQWLKYYLLKGKARHMEDIRKINASLEDLKDIEMPEGIDYLMWVEREK